MRKPLGGREIHLGAFFCVGKGRAWLLDRCFTLSVLLRLPTIPVEQGHTFPTFNNRATLDERLTVPARRYQA